MALENLFIRTKRYIGEIQLDAVIKESHDNPIRVTKNPVELGADITDHAVIEPIKLQIEGVVTDTPLGGAAVTQLVDTVTGFFGSSLSDGITRSQQAYASLILLKNEREPINIQTGLKLYENMLIVNIRTTQDKDTAKAVILSIDAEEIIITETEVVEIPPEQLESGNTTAQAQSNTNRGRQETTELTDESSVKKSALKSLGGWLN